MTTQYAIASQQVVGKVIDGEAVVINLDTGMYFGTDGIGAIAWDLATQGVPVEALTQAIAARYPGSAAAADLAAFVAALVDAGLLVATPDAVPAPLPATIAWPAAYAAPLLDPYDDIAEMVALDPPLPELSRINPA